MINMNKPLKLYMYERFYNIYMYVIINKYISIVDN